MESWKGYLIAGLFFLASSIQSILYQHSFHISGKMSVRVRAGLIDSIYKKALTVSPAAASACDSAKIVNLLAIDLERLQMLLQFIWVFWVAPLNIIITMVLLFIQIGWVSFIGLGVLIVAFLYVGMASGAIRHILVFLFGNSSDLVICIKSVSNFEFECV